MGDVEVWYFDDKPTIGFCAECSELAQYRVLGGLCCPNSKDHPISVFVWDGNSSHPDSSVVADEEEDDDA